MSNGSKGVGATPVAVALTRTHSNLSLRAQRGNLVAVAMLAVAMMVRRRVLNLNEIATPLDKLGMRRALPAMTSRLVWFD